MGKTLNEIILKTKRKLFLNFFGEHDSIFSGNGLDFKEVREYNTSDDIRHINWKVTARNQTPSVNIFNETKQLNIVLVYLNSGGLDFGEKTSKKDVAIEVLTALGYAIINNNDMLTTIFYSNKQITFHKPTKHKSIININFDKATKLEPLGNDIDYKELNTYLLNKIKKKSIIFLIGDFLEAVDFSSIAYKHEVYCTILRDKAEEDLSILGEYNFIDSSTLKEQNISIDKQSIKKYNKLFKAQDTKLLQHLKTNRINYQKIYTSNDVIKKLNHLTRI